MNDLDIITMQGKINASISELREAWKTLKVRADDKAKTSGEYEKAIAITIIKLKNGVEFDFEGQKILSPPVTIIEKIARGICFREKIAMEQAEALYKNANVVCENIRTEINAYQSLLKFIE